MATLSRIKGGFDYHFVEEPPQGLKCVICQAVARQPQQHGECGRLFCSTCLTQYMLTSTKCPNCEQQLLTFFDGKSDKQVRALQVKCYNTINGCQWVGSLEKMPAHSQRCDYQVVKCPNNCDCSPPILQKNMEGHLTACPKRQHQCPHCSALGTYEDLTITHLSSCPKVEVECPYTDCTRTIQRCYIELHTNNCPNKTMKCKFKPVGCAAQVKQANLQEHEQDDLTHLELMKNKVLELTRLLRERETRFRKFIEERNEQLADLRHSTLAFVKYKGPATLKFQGFDAHKLQNKPFVSMQFYLKTGYKFQLIVCANGLNLGKNTHVSVYLCIVQNREEENDDLTRFRGSVKVELLNQLQDKNHLTCVIRFSGDENVTDRMSAGRHLRGWGKDYFISNKQLANMSSKTQYLMKDTLYFRITSVEPEKKRWGTLLSDIQ